MHRQQERGTPGANHNGELWYSVGTPGSGSTTWGASTKVQNLGISGVPTPVVLGDTLYLFHEGSGDCGELWCITTTDGVNWGADVRVLDVGISSGCGATRYQF